jgi:hypothetical protein
LHVILVESEIFFLFLGEFSPLCTIWTDCSP